MESKRCSKSWRKLTHLFIDERADFAGCAELFGAGARVDYFVSRSFCRVTEDLVQRSFWMAISSAANHEARVDHDAGQPGTEGRPAFKRSQPGIGLAQTILHCVLCVLPVAQYAKRNSAERVGVASEYLLLGVRISVDRSLNDVPFVTEGRGATFSPGFVNAEKDELVVSRFGVRTLPQSLADPRSTRGMDEEVSSVFINEIPSFGWLSGARSLHSVRLYSRIFLGPYHNHKKKEQYEEKRYGIHSTFPTPKKRTALDSRGYFIALLPRQEGTQSRTCRNVAKPTSGWSPCPPIVGEDCSLYFLRKHQAWFVTSPINRDYISQLHLICSQQARQRIHHEPLDRPLQVPGPVLHVGAFAQQKIPRRPRHAK
jgi:hypothetical protein